MTKPRDITLPRVVWALGDPEQHTHSGVTVATRPLYYSPDGTAKNRRQVGSLNPDYADVVYDALTRETGA